MVITFNLPSFDSCKQVFVWTTRPSNANSSSYLDGTNPPNNKQTNRYLLMCDVLCIQYAEMSLVASHLLCSYSALKVCDECPGLDAYGKINIKRERIRRVFDIGVTLQSFQNDFRLDNAAVA